MSKKTPHSNHQINEEASYWFVAFRTQDTTESTRRDFQDWLKHSPEHIRAYLEIASVYADIPTPEHGRTPPELIERARTSSEINIASFPQTLGRVARSTSLARDPHPRPLSASEERGSVRTRTRGEPLRFAIAASMLVVVIAAAWLFTQRGLYSTDVGEQRSITMTDGSIVELNARSKIRISLDDQQRNVQLIEGQALFRVAKDPNRPFIVNAGTTTVRAVGTQFDVNRKSAGTTVTVLEGRVAVDASMNPHPPRGLGTFSPDVKKDAQAPDPFSTLSTLGEGPVQREGEVLLAAGEQLTITPLDVQKIERPNIAAATAWTQHQLIFDGTPLAEVLEEFSRYTTKPLVVDSPGLANLKISGQYTSTSPDSLLRFLSLQNAVAVTEVDGEIHIRQE